MGEDRSARRSVEGVGVAHALGELLPAMFHDDELAQRFCAGFDDVLAPAAGVFDNLDAYVDPRLAPGDFVTWLGSWAGLEFDEVCPTAHRRRLVLAVSEELKWRGTIRSLTDLVREHVGVEPVIEESGGTTWSTVPGAAPPGNPEPWVTIRLTATDGLDLARLREVVRTSVPAHLAVTVEVVSESPNGEAAT